MTEDLKRERLSPELVLKCKLTVMRHRIDTLHELNLERARLKYKPSNPPTFRPKINKNSKKIFKEMISK